MGLKDQRDEPSLIKQFKDGDLSIFEVILRKYQNRIYNLCRYLLGNPQDAEDAAQDLFLKNEFQAEDLASTEASPEQRYQSKEIGRAIQAALDRLPGDSRAVIVLREMEGLSYEEMAEVLHTSDGTIKSRISRAREELFKLLQKNTNQEK